MGTTHNIITRHVVLGTGQARIGDSNIIPGLATNFIAMPSNVTLI